MSSCPNNHKSLPKKFCPDCGQKLETLDVNAFKKDHTEMIEEKRQRLMKMIEEAKGRDGKKLVDCLKSDDARYLSIADLGDIYVNAICWERNDVYAKQLDENNANEAFENLKAKMHQC